MLFRNEHLSNQPVEAHAISKEIIEQAKRAHEGNLTRDAFQEHVQEARATERAVLDADDTIELFLGHVSETISGSEKIVAAVNLAIANRIARATGEYRAKSVIRCKFHPERRLLSFYSPRLQ